MTVLILDLATATADVLDGVFEVWRLCQIEETPDEPPRTRAEMEGFLRHPPASDARDYWVAEDRGGVVGFARLIGVRGSPVLNGDVLVHPDARRRAHGTRLLEQVVEAARRRGARQLVGSHAIEAGSRFAARAGAVDSQREVRSLLRLPAGGTAAPVEGYELESWVGAAPERLLDSFARAREAINDAPFPSDEEREAWDAARVRDLEAAVERRDRDIRVTVALDAGDEVVAFTELRVSRAPGAVATTEDTAVVAAHRNRGLGGWVKLESLRQLHADRPDVELVTTTNAEENEPILRLNGSLGFVPVSVHTTCVLEVQG
jgi:GNAT superfamily N-acetyltransferase